MPSGVSKTQTSTVRCSPLRYLACFPSDRLRAFTLVPGKESFGVLILCPSLGRDNPKRHGRTVMDNVRVALWSKALHHVCEASNGNETAPPKNEAPRREGQSGALMY